MKGVYALLAGAAVILVAQPARASGFYLQEQSAKEIGRGLSGGAAAADDPSTIFFNPAGMTELSRTEISANLHILFVDVKQEDRGSTRTIPGVPAPVPVGGVAGGTPFAQPLLVPAAYQSFRIGQSPVWVGLAVNSPFGVRLHYRQDFFGRYDSTYSDLKTVNISPAIAVRVNDHVSVGGGVDIQQIDVKLFNRLPNLSPLQPDGQAFVQGDDLSVGWNVGVLLKQGPWRLGGSYRSRIKHRLDGFREISGLQGPLAASNGTLPATAPLTLPDSATVSVMYGAGRRFRLMATGKWFNWSVFKEIRVEPVGAPATVTPQNYRDVWSGALGAEYDVSPRLTLRAGSLYDQTPTQDLFRTTRIPDGDRIWATGGLSYRLGRRIEVNLSYAHIFVRGTNVDRRDAFYEGTPAAIAVRTRAFTRSNADEIATSVTLRL